MPDLRDGESAEVQGSARSPYILKNVGGVYSCSCPAWRNQSLPIERRSCKHLRTLRTSAAEDARIGSTSAPVEPANAPTSCSVPPLLLAHTWENDIDLEGWFLSELCGTRHNSLKSSPVNNFDTRWPWFRSRQRNPCVRALDGPALENEIHAIGSFARIVVFLTTRFISFSNRIGQHTNQISRFAKPHFRF